MSYSVAIPLSLSTAYAFNLATLNTDASAPGAAQAVFYSYPSANSPNQDVGYSNLTFGMAGVPEPAAWTMMLLGACVVRECMA